MAVLNQLLVTTPDINDFDQKVFKRVKERPDKFDRYRRESVYGHRIISQTTRDVDEIKEICAGQPVRSGGHGHDGRSEAVSDGEDKTEKRGY